MVGFIGQIILLLSTIVLAIGIKIKNRALMMISGAVIFINVIPAGFMFAYFGLVAPNYYYNAVTGCAYEAEQNLTNGKSTIGYPLASAHF